MKTYLFYLELTIITALFWIMASSPSLGHARFKLGSGTPPRTDATGLKVAPCGGVPRVTTPKTFKPGETITVEWTETVQHPGKYLFSFSEASELGFEDNLLLTVADEEDDPQTIPHEYTAQITLPNIQCEDCTIQLIQVMEEDPDNPSNYYSCSDIKLTNDELPPIEEDIEEAPKEEDVKDKPQDTAEKEKPEEAGSETSGELKKPAAPKEVTVNITGGAK